MPGPALLDVNLLIALVDPDHVHHQLAHDWFEDNRRFGWATCPATEGGFLRVLGNPAYGSVMHRVADLTVLLRSFCADSNHQFWAAGVSLRDETIFDPAVMSGHRQVTDVYLLGLAKKHGGCLATFDRTIPLHAVKGADLSTLAVISPAS